MKLQEALAQIKIIQPSGFEDTVLVRWISELDARVYDDVLAGTSNAAMPLLPYHTDMDAGRVLLVPFPHDSIYITWLKAMIDFANGEFDRYNNDMTLYNSEWNAFAAAYVRRNGSKGGGRFSIRM